MLVVDSYIQQLENWQIELFQELSELILSAHPSISMNMKYGVPFFEYRGGFIYYAHNKAEDTTLLGFTRGHLFQMNHSNLVANQGQKEVRHWVFRKDQPIEWSSLIACIQEAIYWQEVLSKKCNC